MTFGKTVIVIMAIPMLAFVNESFNKVKAEDYGEKYLNWHHADPKKDKKIGISTNRAYKELLAGKTPKKLIVVAVIDGGIDPDHEDLKSKMWINEDEIDGNGIDDDKNGYIDDIYGWNFLGNKKGDNIDHEALELTRTYRQLKPKYINKTSVEITEENKAEYELFKETRDRFKSELNDANENLKNISSIENALRVIDPVIEKLHGSDNYMLEDVKKLKSNDDREKQLIKIKINLLREGITTDAIIEAKKHFEGSVKYNLNPDFDPRSKIIGDDITDITDNNYGNPDVKGPDASHGTFVAGIIGAVRDNDLGIDGIAHHIRIMALRAIPNGDEYDKDVALAIRYAVDNGAHVINMSFGKMYSPQKYLVDDALLYAETHGVLIVNAAGNDHVNVDKDYHYPIDRVANGDTVSNMITVGASSMSRKKDLTGSFSNFGQNNVDIFAPGVSIISLAPDNQYNKSDGTSAASPVVAGVAALIWTYYPHLSASELKQILMESVYNYQKKNVNLPSEAAKAPPVKFGALSVSGGVVNVYNALMLAEDMSKIYETDQ